jgi:hypothetical protein
MASFFGKPVKPVARSTMFGYRPEHNAGGTLSDCCGQTKDDEAPGYIAPCCYAAYVNSRQRTGILGRMFGQATAFNAHPARPAA